MTKTNLTLLLSFLALAPLISAGCSAGNTYVRAIGSWKSAPVAFQVHSNPSVACTALSSVSWLKKLATGVKERLNSDLQLTIDSSGAYVAQIHGREINGRLEITSIFGDGLGVSTEFGSVRKEARVRMVDNDRMVLQSAGTEITLVRTH